MLLTWTATRHCTNCCEKEQLMLIHSSCTSVSGVLTFNAWVVPTRRYLAEPAPVRALHMQMTLHCAFNAPHLRSV